MSRIISVPKRLFFLNTGVITPIAHYRRRWEANRKYGFVSAGHNKASGRSIQKLKKEDIICAYISRYGFVAIGQIGEDVKPIGESFLNTDNPEQDWSLINQDLKIGLFSNIGDKNLQEYVAKVNWIKDPFNDISTAIINPTRPETIRFCSTQGKGFKIYQGVCCEVRKDNTNQQKLIEFIENGFDIYFQI